MERIPLILFFIFGVCCVNADAQNIDDLEDLGTFNAEDVSASGMEYRTLDGSGNNLAQPGYGAAGGQLIRLTVAAYADGVSAMAGGDRPDPRVISNGVMMQQDDAKILRNKSAFLWQWGQFIDHDLDLTPVESTAEIEPIVVPPGDPFFDPNQTGSVTLNFFRSQFDPATGSGPTNVRQQLNNITPWIDASNVYGSDLQRALALRAFDGAGRLNVSAGNLLPFNSQGLPNEGDGGSQLFLAGDVRANEQLGLTSLHTLFVREHNRLAVAFNEQGVFGDDAFFMARKIVGALMQSITYNEFLPNLLGSSQRLPEYAGYRDDIDPQIANEFSTAAFRVGHTMLNPFLLRLDENFDELGSGHLPLRDAFFAPHRLVAEGGIDPILRGLAAQRAFEIDVQIIDDVRNFLFGLPGEGGLDLASFNIQRGRDHGLPSYNEARRLLNLDEIPSITKMNASKNTKEKIAAVYGDIEAVDFWVGGIAEKLIPSGHVGELFAAVIMDQFRRLRDGDRFWYELEFSGEALHKIHSTRLADVIVRNTSVTYAEIGRNVFKVVTPREP